MESPESSEHGPRRVIGLGAICDLIEVRDEGRTTSFSVGEFADLDDGTSVPLHDELGLTLGWNAGVDVDPDGLIEDIESLTGDVLNVVLPDGKYVTEDHPWEWLAGLAQAQGLSVTADDLRPLPYRVVFTPAVMALTRPGETSD